MLTESQSNYLLTIPETQIAVVNPWDPKAAQFAKELVAKINAVIPGVEVFWSGALALGISGLNDVDLSILSRPADFEKHLPKLVSVLGEPTKKNEENILWRIILDGHKVDAYLGDKDSESIQLHKKIFNILKNDPKLLDEYRLLKEGANSLPFREYQKRKYEFYNRILE